jgi:hypothetical protein
LGEYLQLGHKKIGKKFRNPFFLKCNIDPKVALFSNVTKPLEITKLGGKTKKHNCNMVK